MERLERQQAQLELDALWDAVVGLLYQNKTGLYWWIVPGLVCKFIQKFDRVHASRTKALKEKGSASLTYLEANRDFRPMSCSICETVHGCKTLQKLLLNTNSKLYNRPTRFSFVQKSMTLELGR